MAADYRPIFDPRRPVPMPGLQRAGQTRANEFWHRLFVLLHGDADSAGFPAPGPAVGPGMVANPDRRPNRFGGRISANRRRRELGKQNGAGYPTPRTIPPGTETYELRIR